MTRYVYGILVEWISKWKPKYSQSDKSKWHFVHHISHTDWPQWNPDLRDETQTSTLKARWLISLGMVRNNKA